MNQRYLLPVALLRIPCRSQLLGSLVLLGLLTRPGQAQTPSALTHADCFENFAGIHSQAEGLASSPGAAPSALVGALATSGGFGDGSSSNNLALDSASVTLTAFEGQRQPDGTVLLTWRTAGFDSASFVLERSRDGLTFGPVGPVPGQGSSPQPTSYRYLDSAAPVGQLYYCLRQGNSSGPASYSAVVAVSGAGAVARLGLYPSPALSQLTLLLPAAAVGQPVQVLDLGGRRVAVPSGPHPTELDVSQLAAGTYLVQVGAGGASLTRRFVKL